MSRAIRKTLAPEEARMLTPVVLAYIGDAAWEIAVRTALVTAGYSRMQNLHKGTVARVRASAQADFVSQISQELSDIEADILRRGSNAHPQRLPKSASLSEYRLSTGFEALVGFWWLTGQDEKLDSLLKRVIAAV